MRIGVLGGTGPAGQALVARLAASGFDVVVGSRSADRAEEIVKAVKTAWPDMDLPVEGASNVGAASAPLVVVATPWDAAFQLTQSVGDQLRGKVVISMANALIRIGNEFQPLVPPRGSVAASVQAAAPHALVSAALHHVPAKELGDLAHPVTGDVLVCSDYPAATQSTMDVISAMSELRPLDAGPLSQATPIEQFTAVLLQLNMRYKTRVTVRFDGIKRA